jgi:hypothetical protein
MLTGLPMDSCGPMRPCPPFLAPKTHHREIFLNKNNSLLWGDVFRPLE